MTTIALLRDLPKEMVHGSGITRDSDLGSFHYLRWLRHGEFDRSMALSIEVALILESEHLTRARKRGWWRIAQFNENAAEFEVLEAAAWLFIREFANIDLIIVGHGRWLIASKPECALDHEHSSRLIPGGEALCTDLDATPSSIRAISDSRPTNVGPFEPA